MYVFLSWQVRYIFHFFIILFEPHSYPNCIPCNCDVQGSQRTTCDAETGQCTCFTYIAGRRCDRCMPDYFNFPRCEDCKCDPRGIKSIVSGVCLAFTTVSIRTIITSGTRNKCSFILNVLCYCRVNVIVRMMSSESIAICAALFITILLWAVSAATVSCKEPWMVWPPATLM